MNTRINYLIVFLVMSWILMLPWCLVGKQPAERVEDINISLTDVIKFTLEKNPNIHLQEQTVSFSKGVYIQSKSFFDPYFSFSSQQGYEYDPILDQTLLMGKGLGFRKMTFTNYSLNVYTQSKWGISFVPSLKYNRVKRDPFLLLPMTQNMGSVNFTIQVPLLQGRLGMNSRYLEKSAELDYNASIHDLYQTVSDQIYKSIQAYWGYLAAFRFYKIAKESYDRANFIFGEIQQMVYADELPAAELKQLQANKMDKKISLTSAEQNLIQSRHTLGLALGLDYQAIESIGKPVDVFPVNKTLEDSLPSMDYYLQLAMSNRADYEAIQNRLKAARSMVRAKKNELEPVLNLSLNAGYSGFDIGDDRKNYITPFHENTSDMNIMASLSYEMPILNRQARGEFLQRHSVLTQQQIECREWERQIRSQISVSHSALRSVLIELKSAQQAVDLYKLAHSNEVAKVKLGESTLINLDAVEEQLTSASYNLSSIQLKYANSVLQLRYLTGTLIKYKDDRYITDIETITTIPVSP